jgi:hypothetical protein
MTLAQRAQEFLDIVMTNARDEHGLVRAILTYPDHQPITLDWTREKGMDDVSKWTGLGEPETLMYEDAYWRARAVGLDD